MSRTLNAMLEKMKLDVRISQGREVEFRSTGIYSLDQWTKGGIPRGNLTLFWGAERMFKSTLAMIMARNALLRGERVVWIDTENWFNNQYADKIGFPRDLKDAGGEPLFYLAQSRTAENLLEFVTQVLRGTFADWVFIDSITNLSPQSEMDANTGQQQVALQARLLNTWLRRTMPDLFASGACIVGISQVRVAIGSYHAPTIMAGGKAIRHQSALRIQFLSAENKDSTAVIKLRNEKNKVSENTYYSEIELGFVKHNGAFDIDVSREAAVIGVAAGVLTDKNGAPWSTRICYFEGAKIADGKKDLLEVLDADPDLRARILLASKGVNLETIAGTEDEPGSDEEGSAPD